MRLESRIAGIGLFTCALSGCGAVASDTSEAQQTSESIGESASALGQNALSSSEEQKVLKLIDDICGDTWCEGDNNFSFDSLRCRSAHGHGDGSCTLRLQILPRDDSEPPRSFARTCTTHGFRNFESLVMTTASGYQSLQPAYYDALTQCIGELEAALPR